ncbi:MAG TPA: DNA primase [Gemmatimonadaceae bacterium]|jgi:DNA primase|nr:DNA primase [Gemmatimonadaceae bacterium]
MISDETIERVEQAADIVQIIGEHVNLRRTGADFRGPCPFHQGTKRNFSVSPSKGIYYCFVCHEGGSVFTFLQKRLGMDYPSAVRYVADRVGIIVEEEQRRQGPDPRQPLWDVNAAVADYFRTTLWTGEEGRAARDYLALRRVSQEVADRFGLGFAPRDADTLRTHFNALGIDDAQLLEAGVLVQREDQSGPRPRFRNRLMFPILDAQGNCAGFGGRLLGPGEPKYLNSAESKIFSKGRLLYGFHMARHVIRRDDRVMIVEGYFDVVRLVSAGYAWVVAPLGTALTESQAALVRRFTRNAYLLYDSDEAGLKATFRAGDELLRHGMAVQVVTLPDGEDPDSFVDKFGGEKLAAQVENAIDVFERKLQLLERKGWFADLHRKRRALDRLLPTLRATADPVTRDIYLTRTAEALGVTRAVLEREVSAGTGGAPASAAVASAGANRRTSSHGGRERKEETGTLARLPGTQTELIRILIHDRSRLEEIAEQLGPDALSHPGLRLIFTAMLERAPDASASELADALPEPVRPLLDALLAQPPGEGFDARAALDGAVARLRDEAMRREMQEKMREMSLASDEQKDRLLGELANLTRDRRALGAAEPKRYSGR